MTTQETMGLSVTVFAAILGLVSVGAGTGTHPPAAPATGGPDWRDDVAAFARRVVDAGLVPGTGVAVTRDDRVEWSAGFGVADAETGRAVDDGTTFYIASTTKALTATAVVLRATRGEIDLDSPVSRYVPGLAFAPPIGADGVTVGALLSMTDGLEDAGPVVVRTAYTGDFTRDLLVELLAGYGPAEEGTAFSYDNLPYVILGLALDPARADGWKDAVRAEVLEPLGMRETSARMSELDSGRIAMPHSLEPGGGYGRVPLAKADETLHAAGGHFTTARDLGRFVAAHASGGRLDGRQVFPREAIESTHALRAEQDRTFGPYHRFGWGYGWDLGTWEDRTIVHRFGSFRGYRSHMSFEPESRTGVVVLVNGDGPASPAADLVASYVYDRLLGRADLEAEYDRRLEELVGRADEAERELTEHLAERAARQVPLPHPPGAYAGLYASPRFGTIEWRVVDDGLEARMGIAQGSAEVFDAAENALRVELFGGGSVCRFEFAADDGPATAMTMHGQRFERVE